MTRNTQKIYTLATVLAAILTIWCSAQVYATDQMPLGFSGPLDPVAMQNLKPADIVPVPAGDKRLDAWWETYLNFGTATRGGDIRKTPYWRVGWRKLREKMPFSNAVRIAKITIRIFRYGQERIWTLPLPTKNLENNYQQI